VRPLPPRLARRLGRTSGVEVVDVAEASPADRAGFRPEDLIVELNGVPVEAVDDIQRLMVAELIGTTVRAHVIRNAEERELELVPAELDIA
jgi:S1-C subfamily serine protease